MSIKLLNLVLFWCFMSGIFGDPNSDTEAYALNETTSDLRPPGMIICSRNSSNSVRANCIKDSINQLLPQLRDGFPPLDFPVLDPFYVNRTYVEYEQNILRTQLNITDTLVSGVSTAEVKSVRTKMNSTHLYVLFDLHIPVAQLEADFTGKTTFNDLVVPSQGHAIVDCFGVVAAIKLYGALETLDDGEDYMVIQSAKIVDLTMKQMKLNGTGLLPDPDLNEVVVEILNEVWETLLQQVFPKFKSSWDPIVLELINLFFGKVPYKMLMKDV